MSYFIKRKLVGKNTFLDSLTMESGSLYTKTLVFFWRTVRKKNIWLKPKSLMRIFSSENIHAHSADASVQAFFQALSSWREHRKSDPDSNPPTKLRKFYPITWKSSAIRLKDGKLILSNGKNQVALMLKNWKYDIPKICMLRYTGKEYEMIFTYQFEPVQVQIETENVVAVDLGIINFAACSNGLMYNGRLLRSFRQWKDKKLADFQSLIAKTTKNSRRNKHLRKQKAKFLVRFNNKVKDILHKYTTGLVLTQKNSGVNTLVVGDLSGYRKDKDDGHTRNQENHQWVYGITTFMLRYKSEKRGMMFKLQEESYTSITCPNCFREHKCKGRNFKCPYCGYEAHRDMVGSTNILSKYRGFFGTHVVPVMAPGLCVRFHANARVTNKLYPKRLQLLEAAGF